MGPARDEPIIAGMGGAEVVTHVAGAVMANVGRAIVNKEDEVRLCLVTLLCEGHLLIEDVPGVGTDLRVLREGAGQLTARAGERVEIAIAVDRRANRVDHHELQLIDAQGRADR